MLHAKNFDPLSHVQVCITDDGVPKYEQKMVDGLPVFDDEGRMVLKPATYIPFADMLEWFYTEYPTGVIIPERKTQEAMYSKDIDEIIYPKEIFECKIYTDKTRETPDAVGYGACESDTEYDPMGTARTKSIKDALRTLGFGIGIKDEDAVNALPDSIAKEIPGRIVPLEEREGFFTVPSENVVESKKESIVDKDELKKTVEDATAKGETKDLEKDLKKGEANSETPEDKTEEAPKTSEKDEPVVDETTKEESEEPAETAESPAEEIKTEGEESEAETVENDIPEIFKSSDELMAIAKEPFKVLKTAPKTMTDHADKTFAQVYKDSEGLIRILAKQDYDFKDKVPEEIAEMCRIIWAAKEEESPNA